MYNFESTKHFKKELLKLLKSDKLSFVRYESFAEALVKNPFDIRLRTHKVTTKSYGKRYNSKLTSDLRVIWDFDRDKNLILLLLDIGGHDGNRAVYKTR
ncbi:MAG: hypothetical protein HOA17_02200 [Candidatus Melainabacteria bacterium]|jgi:mRNA-degrading endonuclease YafQ of YafQ-DinJ toxin-antitoxin module|nr:hypothetical protein [Candidatus Melainabacteria bacterium]